MNYKQIEEYILNIPKFRPEGSIEKTRKFYEFLGKPGSSASIIHVAGTNGKGSVCAYMNSVLTEAGYKVGMFTSPHLVSVRERMRINGDLISKKDFEVYFQKLINCAESYNFNPKEPYDNYVDRIEITLQNKDFSEDKYTRENGSIEGNKTAQEYRTINNIETNQIKKNQEYTPTFYEFLFFMAMLYFEEQNPDVIILETGLGGRLDATNVIDAPKVAVITEIGKDHVEYLGDTYEKIAEEKAGIIKPGSCVVYSRNRQESAQVIERKAKELGVLCKSVEKVGKQDFRFVDKKIDFSFFSRYYEYTPIRLNTCAVYQIENARVALTALEEMGLPISKEAMRRGMLNARWEGRMEEILPKVYLDGAHNEDGIEAFIESVKNDGCKAKRWLLFSVVADKEYIAMKEKLVESGLFDFIYAAPLKNVRGIGKKELEYIFDEYKFEDNHKKNKVMILDSSYEGLQEILYLKKEEDIVYITGSLYLAGEIKEHFGGNND